MSSTQALAKPQPGQKMNYTPWCGNLKKALFKCIFDHKDTEIFYDYEVEKDEDTIFFFCESKNAGIWGNKKCIKHNYPNNQYPKSCAYRYSEEQYEVIEQDVVIKKQYYTYNGIVYCCGGLNLFVFEGTISGLPYGEDRGTILMVSRMPL